MSPLHCWLQRPCGLVSFPGALMPTGGEEKGPAGPHGLSRLTPTPTRAHSSTPKEARPIHRGLAGRHALGCSQQRASPLPTAGQMSRMRALCVLAACLKPCGGDQGHPGEEIKPCAGATCTRSLLQSSPRLHGDVERVLKLGPEGRLLADPPAPLQRPETFSLLQEQSIASSIAQGSRCRSRSQQH